METAINNTEDVLIDGLTYKLGPGATYITNRKSATFHPLGSNVYAPTQGTKLIKIVLAADEFLDPSTVKLQFDLVNADESGGGDKVLRPLGGAHIFFRRVRVLCGGAIIEDIDDYNRIHEMFLRLTTSNYNDDLTVEGIETPWSSLNDFTDDGINAVTVRGIDQNSRKVVSFAPLLGILKQEKYLPLRNCPLTMEFELVSTATEVLFGQQGTDAGPPAEINEATNNSVSWRLENVEIKCDLCTLDNSLENSIAEHLINGNELKIHYNSYISQLQTITSADVSININRAVSRLKSLFITLTKNNYGAIGWKHKDCNIFYHPMWSIGNDARGDFNMEKELQFQVQIGSQLFPEYPIKSQAEAFSQLKKSLGAQASPLHGFKISPRAYRSTHFIVGIDTEKVLEAGYTGQNLRNGSLMTIKMKGANLPIDAADTPNRMHVVMNYDAILSISSSGAMVYD